MQEPFGTSGAGQQAGGDLPPGAVPSPRATRRPPRRRLVPPRLPTGRAQRAAVVAAGGLALVTVVAVAVVAAQEMGRSPGAVAPTTIAVASPQASDAGPGITPSPAPASMSPAPTTPPESPRPTVAPAAAAWSLPPGWRYELECDDRPCVLHLFDEDQREQDGWPVTVRGDCQGWVVVGPNESAFVPCTRKGSAVVTALSRDGTPLAGWPVSTPGSVAWVTWNAWAGGTAQSPLAIGPDGTVYLGVDPRGTGERFRIHAFKPNGTTRRGWPASLPGAGQGFAMAPDGIVVAWWYEGIREAIDLQARRTRFTMLDRAGRPLPGWPIGSTGAASGPVIRRDGGITYTSATGKVWSHDRGGEVVDGWPYRLPYPIAPVPWANGAMLFVGSSEIHVVDERGRAAPGWPWHTRATLEAPTCDTDSYGSEVYALGADDTLYLATWNGSRGELLALAPDGTTRAGWPYPVPDGWRVTGIGAASDGTVEAQITGGECLYGFDDTSIRLTPTGTLIGDPPGAPLSVVYDALRPTGLRTSTGQTSFRQGEPITFQLELVNRSAIPIALPLVDHFGDSYYAAGTIQTWLERRGQDPETDCVPGAGRKAHWYATGGWIQVSAVPVTIQPDGSLPLLFDTSLLPERTACLPPGDYRFHVEYKPLGGELEDVLAARSLAFTLTAGAAPEPAVPPTPPSPPPNAP